MEYTKVHNIPGILIALDFKKAFDSLERGYIINTLDAFNLIINYYIIIIKIKI